MDITRNICPKCKKKVSLGEMLCHRQNFMDPYFLNNIDASFFNKVRERSRRIIVPITNKLIFYD